MASLHSPFPLWIYTLTLILILIPNSHSRSSPPSTIYDYLTSHALPVGLFPKGISDFSLDPTTARFQFHLPSSCSAKFETHVRYNSTVAGTLSYGRLSDISGVSAEELFLWLPVKAVHVDVPSSGLIYFDVEVVSKQFSLSYFETPRDCTATGDEHVEFLLFDDHGRAKEIKSGNLVEGHYTGHVGTADA